MAQEKEPLKIDPKLIEQARKENYSDGEILNYLGQKYGIQDKIIEARKNNYHDNEILDFYSQKAVTPKSTGQVIDEGIKGATGLEVDPATILSTIAGTGTALGMDAFPATAPFSGPASSGAAALVDNIVRYVTGEKEFSALGTAKDAAINEVGGRILGAVPKVPKVIEGSFSKLLDNANPDPLSILNLKPTYGQTLENEGSHLGGMVGGFEDLFSPNAKKRALTRSYDLAKDEGEKFIEQTTGRKIKLDTPNALAQTIKEDEEKQFLALKNESNWRGEQAKLIAEQNTQDIYKDVEKEVTTTDAYGVKSTSKQIVKEKVGTVKGPVHYQETLNLAKALKEKMFQGKVKPAADSPVLRVINNILEGAEFDEKGNLTNFDPVDFGAAWNDKQAVGHLAYDKKLLSDANINQTDFARLNSAMDNDIENSIPTWKNNSKAALTNYLESKALVEKRIALFTPADETGKSLESLINKQTKPVDSINAVLDDPEKLKRFLMSGNIQVPNGTRMAIDSKGNLIDAKAFKYISSNARKDAQGYQMMRMLNEASQTIDKTKQVFNPEKLMELVNDPTKQETLKLIYGSEGLSNVKQLFKNIAITSQRGGNLGPSRYLALKLGVAGVTLAAGIPSLIAGDPETSLYRSGFVLTASLGGFALARLMTNPTSARLMISLSRGEPLGMSTKLATRMIVENLRNMPITLNYSDGNSVDGKINSQGKFVIPIETNSKFRSKIGEK
jgi:hypothetical protein